MSTIPKTQYELSDNVHPNVDRSPWGWIVIKGTRLRVATYSGYEEKERCKMLIESAQLATDGREELEKENGDLRLGQTYWMGKFYNAENQITALQSSLKEKEKECEGLKANWDEYDQMGKDVNYWSRKVEELKAENERLKEENRLLKGELKYKK